MNEYPRHHEVVTHEEFTREFGQLIGVRDVLLARLMIENLPLINAQHGTEAGQAVIDTVTHTLIESARSCIVGRVSPSLYAMVCLSSEDPEGLVANLNRIIDDINQSHVFDFVIETNFGVVVARHDEHLPLNDWIKKANTAMLHSSHSGVGEILNDQTVVAERIREIFARLTATSQPLPGMRWVFQRINDGVTGEVFGYEALCRWSLPGFGEVPPDFFIPLAEKMGVIEIIDMWALKSIEYAHKELFRHGGHTISVNVSAQTLRGDETFIRVLDEILERNKECGSALILELTETSVVKDQEDLIRKLALLRERGIHVAIDDFGTGQTSLSSIGRLPCDFLKLDGSLLRAGHMELSVGLLALGMKLGELLGARVIVEGVETPTDLERMRAAGADFIQGWYYGKPLYLDKDGIAREDS